MSQSDHLESDPAQFDHGSTSEFLEYYERESLTPRTIARFKSVQDKALKILSDIGHPPQRRLRIVDIGCGAGTQALMLAELGHAVSGIDVNEPLIRVARKRAGEGDFQARFDVGTATSLPYDSASFDVCLMPELLEHIADWRACLEEAVRVLAPGGLLYLSTTNRLCPVQHEFELPLYSWYPSWVKRRYEQLAVTSRPELANYAKYPAVNWFSYFELRKYLQAHGFRCQDRFDVIDERRLSGPAGLAVKVLRQIPPLRVLGHMATPGTVVFAVKSSPDG